MDYFVNFYGERLHVTWILLFIRMNAVFTQSWGPGFLFIYLFFLFFKLFVYCYSDIPYKIYKIKYFSIKD